MDSPRIGPEEPGKIKPQQSNTAGESNKPNEVNIRPGAMPTVNVEALKGHKFTHEHRNVKNIAAGNQNQRMNTVFNNNHSRVVDSQKQH